MVVSQRAIDVKPVTDSIAEWEFLPGGRHILRPDGGERWHVVFARVSTGEQVRDGGSIPQQIEGGLQAARRKGQAISAIYVDPGKSATRLAFDQRQGIRMLLDDVREGRVATIYVCKRDRVACQSGEWAYSSAIKPWHMKSPNNCCH